MGVENGITVGKDIVGDTLTVKAEIPVDGCLILIDKRNDKL